MLLHRVLLTTFCFSAILAVAEQYGHAAESKPAQVLRKTNPAPDGTNGALPSGAIHRLGVSKFQVSMNYGHPWIRFLPDGRTAVMNSPERKIVFWDTFTGKSTRELAGHFLNEFSPDCKKILSMTDRIGTLQLFDLASEKHVGESPGGRTVLVLLSPDGRYFAVAKGGGPDTARLSLVEVSTGNEVREFACREPIYALAFSPDGKTLAGFRRLGKRPNVHLWEVATGKLLRGAESGNELPPYVLAFSLDSKFLASAGGILSVWNTESGEQSWSLPAKSEERPLGLAFSPNGRMMAVGRINGMIHLYETASGRERHRLEGRAKGVWSVAFSPCGLRLGSAAQDYAPLIWDVTGQISAAKKPPAPLAVKELDACWTDLGGEDAAKAWQAICALTTRPEQAAPFLKKRLPNPRLDAKRLARIQDELENGDFATRHRACKELAEIGPPAIPFLNKLYRSGVTADVRQRIKYLLGESGKGGLLTEERRCLGAIEALEYAGTPQARELLEAQAQGESMSQLAIDAKAALGRLARRAASK